MYAGGRVRAWGSTARPDAHVGACVVCVCVCACGALRHGRTPMCVLGCERDVCVPVWGSTARPDAPMDACVCVRGVCVCV